MTSSVLGAWRTPTDETAAAAVQAIKSCQQSSPERSLPQANDYSGVGIVCDAYAGGAISDPRAT